MRECFAKANSRRGAALDLCDKRGRVQADEVLKRAAPEVLDQGGRAGNLGDLPEESPGALWMIEAGVRELFVRPPVRLKLHPGACNLRVRLHSEVRPANGTRIHPRAPETNISDGEALLTRASAAELWSPAGAERTVKWARPALGGWNAS